MSARTTPSPTTAARAVTAAPRAKKVEIDLGIAPWMVALIDERARRRGYRREELPEIRQEIVPAIAAFRFDPAKANGACERTAITTVIDNQLTMLLRTRSRWQHFREAYAAQQAGEERRRVERTEVVHEVASDLGMDVQAALAGLSASDREVCAALAAGETCVAIAKRLGLTRYAAERRLERIREHFTACGMDAWVRA